MKPNAENAVLHWLLTVRHTVESMSKQTTSPRQCSGTSEAETPPPASQLRVRQDAGDGELCQFSVLLGDNAHFKALPRLTPP